MVIILVNEDIKGFIAESEDEIILALRGTDSPSDWEYIYAPYCFAARRPGAPNFEQDYCCYVPNSFRIYNVHVGTPIPIDFQLNAFWPNHGISCYIKILSEGDPNYADYLRRTTPGFLPDEFDCYYHSGICK